MKAQKIGTYETKKYAPFSWNNAIDLLLDNKEFKLRTGIITTKELVFAKEINSVPYFVIYDPVSKFFKGQVKNLSGKNTIMNPRRFDKFDYNKETGEKIYEITRRNK